jgi:hypothetical protein
MLALLYKKYESFLMMSAAFSATAYRGLVM